MQGRDRFRADTEGASCGDRLIAATKLSGHRTLYLGTLENPTGNPRRCDRARVKAPEVVCFEGASGIPKGQLHSKREREESLR